MLYKKVHRQYLRQFKKGRKFKFYKEVYEAISKPFIDYPKICIWCDWCRLYLIMMVDNDVSHSGEIIGKDKITWLD